MSSRVYQAVLFFVLGDFSPPPPSGGRSVTVWKVRIGDAVDAQDVIQCCSCTGLDCPPVSPPGIDKI